MMAVCLSLVLSGASVASAKAKSKDSKGKSYDGTIKMVNRTMLMLTEPGNSTPVSVVMTKDTTVTINGKPGTVQDLERGQSVTITLKGTNVATITVN